MVMLEVKQEISKSFDEVQKHLVQAIQECERQRTRFADAVELAEERLELEDYQDLLDLQDMQAENLRILLDTQKALRQLHRVTAEWHIKRSNW